MHVLHITIFTKDGGVLFEPLAFLVGLASLNRCPISPTSRTLVGTTSFQEKVHWRRSASSVACKWSEGFVASYINLYHFARFDL
jgi:hypothetical protein